MKYFSLFILAIAYSVQALANNSILDVKTKVRLDLLANHILSEPRENDKAEDLVDNLKYQTIQEMDLAGLKKAKVPEDPWSDSYWPIYAGVISNRYADSNFPASYDWSVNESYLTLNMGKGPVDHLSPAEKYDLLVGDQNFTMTKAMIDEGKPYFDRDHKVETWMGICHGWAPASFMAPRPHHLFKAMAADGKTEITFYPSDVKALTTLLWANGRFPARFISGRCNLKEPPRDPAGRVIDQDCFDTNPGTWHLAVVNQIGVAKRSMVLDVNYDYEVWNQPLIGYQYVYVNPITGKKADKLEDAIVNYKDIANDPYKEHRNPKVEKLVRITMNISYTVEHDPTSVSEDSPEFDARANQYYDYDLELDANGKIIGGEWRSTNHPDFLWVPSPGSKAFAVGDYWLDRNNDTSIWTGKEALPLAWRNYATSSSQMKQPLAHIVERLIQLAN